MGLADGIIYSFSPCDPHDLYKTIVDVFYKNRPDQALSDVRMMDSAQLAWVVPEAVARQYYAVQCPN